MIMIIIIIYLVKLGNKKIVRFLEKLKDDKLKILNYTVKGSVLFFIIKGTISTIIILIGIFYIAK